LWKKDRQSQEIITMERAIAANNLSFDGAELRKYSVKMMALSNRTHITVRSEHRGTLPLLKIYKWDTYVRFFFP